MNKKKENKFTLKNVMRSFVKDLINDAAEITHAKANNYRTRLSDKTVEDVYMDIIARLEIILRMFDKDFNRLPF